MTRANMGSDSRQSVHVQVLPVQVGTVQRPWPSITTTHYYLDGYYSTKIRAEVHTYTVSNHRALTLSDSVVGIVKPASYIEFLDYPLFFFHRLLCASGYRTPHSTVTQDISYVRVRDGVPRECNSEATFRGGARGCVGRVSARLVRRRSRSLREERK
jgi:hypothetical protein